MDANLYQVAREQLAGEMLALRNATRPTDKLRAATTLLNTLGTLAANAPTEELRARWLEQYRALAPQAALLRASVSNDAPGAVMQSLEAFSSAVLTFGNQVVEGAGQAIEGAGGIIGSAPGLLKALPVVLVIVAVLAAVVLVKIGPQLVIKGKK